MKTLFEQPLSHTDDPITSYEAADRMVKSGALSRQEKEVWDKIKRGISNIWPKNPQDGNFTAKELSGWSGLDYYTIQRRLSGLRNKGRIERTGEKRDNCCVWKIRGLNNENR